MKVNTHGLKMNGIRNASSATTTWAGYTQISYDMESGDILVNDHSGSTECSWSEYHDPDVITVLNARRHYTMQEIADAIARMVCFCKMVDSSI